jgi:CBS domain-containing protein
MFSEQVGSLMERNLLTVPPETTVREAATLMAQRRVGAVLVVRDGGLAGIFTERDVVFRVIARGLDVSGTRLGEVMTTPVKTIDSGKTYGYALLLMHENGFRHLPVLDGGRLAGIVSARNAMDPDLEEFVSESRRREQILREPG